MQCQRGWSASSPWGSLESELPDGDALFTVQQYFGQTFLNQNAWKFAFESFSLQAFFAAALVSDQRGELGRTSPNLQASSADTSALVALASKFSKNANILFRRIPIYTVSIGIAADWLVTESSFPEIELAAVTDSVDSS